MGLTFFKLLKQRTEGWTNKLRPKQIQLRLHGHIMHNTRTRHFKLDLWTMRTPLAVLIGSFFGYCSDTMETQCNGDAIPEKILSLINSIYKDMNAGLFVRQNIYIWNKNISATSCLVSAVLFLLIIDWIMKSAITSARHESLWSLTEQPDNLDFTDDIAHMLPPPNPTQRN